MSQFTKLSFIVKCIFALILVLIIFKHPKYRIWKNCVDMCARDGRGAIEIYLSEKGALAKKRSGNIDLHITTTVGDPFEISEVRGSFERKVHYSYFGLLWKQSRPIAHCSCCWTPLKERKAPLHIAVEKGGPQQVSCLSSLKHTTVYNHIEVADEFIISKNTDIMRFFIIT